MSASAAPTALVTLPGPIGIAVAPDSSIFATYDQTNNVALVKLSPQGQVLQQVAFGGFASVGEVGKLAVDPVTGRVWDLFTTGELRTFDPNTLASVTLGSLASTPLDSGSVFDVSQGRRRDMSGEIIPGLSTFGDIALLRSGANLLVFATGRSSSGVPYVARYSFSGNTFAGARAIVAASISSENDNDPRGVAVNPQGNVLTTLPTPNLLLDVVDRAYIFSATYPDAGTAPRLAFGGRDLASRGMTTDAAGNFYVTGFIGTTLCGVNAAGGITVIAPDGSTGLCAPLSPTPVDTEDVAVGPPNAPNVYSTLLAYPGAILSWARLPTPTPAAGGTPGDGGGSIGGGSGGRGSGAPRRALLAADVRAAATQLVNLGLKKLLSVGGIAVAGFHANGAGKLILRLDWGHTLVASGSRTVTKAGRFRVELHVTSAGRRRLKRARRVTLKLTLKLATGSTATQASRKVTLRR